MQYSVQRCEFVSIGPFLYPKKDQIKSKWKYTSIHPDARRRGGAAQIKWRPSIFNLGTLYELRGKDGRAFVGLLMAPLDVHSFFSLCMCVCLSLGSDIVQLAPVFFLSLPCPRLPFQIFQTRLQCFACVCVCMSRFLLLSMLLLLLLLFHCAFRVCFVVAVALFSSACFPPFHYFYYFQYFQYIASGKLDLAPS